jgi:hypothetical protein
MWKVIEFTNEVLREANDLSALVQDYRKFVQDLLGTTESANAQWAHSTLQKVGDDR